MRAPLLCNLLVAVGFEFLNQLLQCRQTGKTCGCGEFQVVHGSDESGVAGYLYQSMKPFETSRCSLHQLDNTLLPICIWDRPGIITVACPAQDLAVDIHSQFAVVALNLGRKLVIDRAVHINGQTCCRNNLHSGRQRPLGSTGSVVGSPRWFSCTQVSAKL